MPDVVGVRFKRASPVYYFDPAGLSLEPNDSVIVETSKGLALGRVVIAPKQVLASEITEPLKPVVRKATPEDFQKIEDLKGQEQEALAKCDELVTQVNLPMKLLRAEYNADGTRLTVFFSSEQRVDFRELLKRLTGTLKTRVELRQVGARDEAKLIGGLGRCGRTLCCSSHLCTFESVSVKLAKEQNLPLNPTKISGLCGKLLCCLGYESCFYKAMKEAMPKIGQRVSTPMGEGKAVETSPLKEMVVVELDNQTMVEVPVSQVTKKVEQAPPAPVQQQQQQRQGRGGGGRGEPPVPNQQRAGGNRGDRPRARDSERPRPVHNNQTAQQSGGPRDVSPQRPPEKAPGDTPAAGPAAQSSQPQADAPG